MVSRRRLADLAQPHAHRVVDRDALNVPAVLVADLKILESGLFLLAGAGGCGPAGSPTFSTTWMPSSAMFWRMSSA